MSGSQVADLVGRRLGERYRLDSVLGHGGMAVVYRAVDETLGRSVAIKVFLTSSADGDELRRQSGEVRMLASLSHPGLVTLFDAGADESGTGSLAYIVMELIEGETLQNRMSIGPLPPAVVATIGADVADALHYIHRRDVVHRDIKPANVLLATSHEEDSLSSTKLADFGIARIIDGTQLTATGTIIGTISYLSPEQALGATVGPSADVYALGLVLLECLTGTKAFPGPAAESVSARVLRDPDIPDFLPGDWSMLLRRMTARAPTERPTAREAAVALRLLQRSPTPDHAPDPDPGRGPDGSGDAPTEALSLDEQPTRPLDAGTPNADPVSTDSVDTDPVSTDLASTDTVAMAFGEPTRPLAAHITADTAAVGAPRRRRKSLGLAVAAIALVIAVVVGWTVVANLTAAENSIPAVQYPDVPGELGTSLDRLQQSVESPE